MTIPGVDRDLSEMMRGVFAKYAGNADRSPGEVDDSLWSELSGLGLTRLTASEESGGSGAGWAEGAELLTAAAMAGVHAPLAENDLLAGALLEAAGLPADDRLRTVTELDSDGVASAVPWASAAERIVVLRESDGGWQISDADPSALQIEPGTNLAGEPRDRVTLTGSLDGTSIDAGLVEQYRLKAALARAIQVSAALDRAMALSSEHVTTRVQFGRPLAKFQAVQNLIADMACECALARAATEGALEAAVSSDWSGEDLPFRIAVARSCAGHAASTVVRNAHQAHGAIGTTKEHDLHRFTRAALAWRGEYGSVRYWDQKIAEAAVDAGPAGLWELIAD